MARLWACAALAASLWAWLPALAGDLSGTWVSRYNEDWDDRLPGPEVGDYAGLPITDGARLFAESWDPSRLSVVEHQCQAHVVGYISRGPGIIRISEERDPRTQDVVAIHVYHSNWTQYRTIWMDGRAHPPAWAAHTWMGFSTGKWDGNVLTVETTHISQGWHRRNGVPSSDKAELTEHYFRHDNLLTRIGITRDPVYLTEPIVKSEDFVLSDRAPANAGVNNTCVPVVEIPREQGWVPHYLPGRNESLKEMAKWGITMDAWSGGAKTMYPGYAEGHDLGLKAGTP